MAKAIVDEDEQAKNIKDSRNQLQKQLAQKLHEEARVPIGPCGLDQIKLFEIILNEYQFVVLSAEHGHTIVHKGPPSDKQIVLLMHDGHFDVITKLPGFFNSVFFVLNVKRPTRQKITNTMHVAKGDVTPAYNPIVVTTTSSNTPKNQNYHAKTVIVISMALRVNSTTSPSKPMGNW